MGVKDSKAKEYLSDNIRFSEICNYMLFGGDKIIKPQDLKECDSTEVLSIFGIDKKQIIRQKWRDLLKNVSVKYTGNMYIVLMGIEAQTDVNYAMPVKTMMYDALNYGDQVNEEKEEVINVCKAWEDHKKLGIQQGENKMLFTLVTKGKLDIDTAAEEAGVSVSEFEKLMREAGYKVPETV